VLSLRTKLTQHVFLVANLLTHKKTW